MTWLERLFNAEKPAPDPETGDELLELLLTTYKKSEQRFFGYCDKYKAMIAEYYPLWKTVPVEYREGTKAQLYANVLISIAKHFHSKGDQSFMAILDPKAANDMFDRWQKTLDSAHELTKADRGEEAIVILNELNDELETLTGSGKDNCQAVLFGRLGQAYISVGDMHYAHEFSMKAYDACQKTGDIMGLIFFTLDLARIAGIKGESEEERHWQIVATNIQIQTGREAEARVLRTKFGIEPLDVVIETNL